MQHHLENPYDVTLVVEGGKEIKAHRIILSKASSFFEKLLNTDMKEGREGVIHLEHCSARIMEDILEFIYTGSVQIVPEDAEEMMIAADFFLLPNLIKIASRSIIITTSNCLSTFFFAEQLNSEELIDKTNKFINANFATVVNSEEFMNLSVQEVERWISSYGVIFCEDDIFNIVVRWINYDKERRQGNLEELFPLGIVACGGNQTFCFIPRQAKWYQLTSSKYEFKGPRQLLSCKAILYNFSLRLFGSGFLCYKPYSRTKCKWTMLKLPSKLVPEMVTVIEDCVYGVGSAGGHRKFISIYKEESNSWQYIPSSDGDIVKGACIVGEGKCLYFIGGIPASTQCRKFDTSEIKWDNTAHMLEGRYNAYGAACHGKIYIAGGKRHGDVYVKTCEVYNVMTNEWHFIASLNIPRSEASMVCCHGTMYVLGGINNEGITRALMVECYDSEKNKWVVVRIPSKVATKSDSDKFQACVLRHYKGVLECFQAIEENENDGDQTAD